MGGKRRSHVPTARLTADRPGAGSGAKKATGKAPLAAPRKPAVAAQAQLRVTARSGKTEGEADGLTITVRRIHRRDIARTWEFLKRVFRDVNRKTVEYQRPRTRRQFEEIYEEEGTHQLLFEIQERGKAQLVGYAECAQELVGDDNWINQRYFDSRDMRPLYVEELAVHPGYQGRGIGAFVMDQLEHLARVRGCTHLVLEVAQNNTQALSFYRKRNFQTLDAALFLAKKVNVAAELLPPRKVRRPGTPTTGT